MEKKINHINTDCSRLLHIFAYTHKLKIQIKFEHVKKIFLEYIYTNKICMLNEYKHNK